MLISLKWLSDYVECHLPPQELADGLTMTGLEAEGLWHRYPYLKDVITVRINSIVPHPNADRLSICSVSSGESVYRVVCGAPNVRVGEIVPLATEGAQLPAGLVRKTSIRGEASDGMLCSAKELDLGEDHGGILLLPSDTPIGVNLGKALGVEDMLLEIGITPNRGDCLSMIGIARETASLCGTTVKYPDVSLEETGPPIETFASVTIDDPGGCPRYTARLIRGVKIGPSPVWLKNRIEAVGLRSINNIVDVTNFVMMELGQPLHAFDFNRVRGHRIVVRKASIGEKFTTLDGVERDLPENAVLICDGEGPVAIGGIMGGLNSEISPETTDVLIESAYFQPRSIRGSSKKLGLKTESSYRFERGIDPEGVLRALDRAARLMQEVGGGSIASGKIDAYPNRLEFPVLTLRVDAANSFLGTGLSAAEMQRVLESIEMRVEPLDDSSLRVFVPSFRPDITREVDLYEEIARLSGYDAIPVTSPAVVADSAPADPHQAARHDIKRLLASAGFFEVINYSFISLESLKKLRYTEGDPRLNPVRLRNPLSDEQSVMRTSLIPGLLMNARYNFDRRSEDLRIFELSKVFLPREGDLLADEPHHIAGAMAGRRIPQPLHGKDEDVDYAEVKGVVESILNFLRIDGSRFRAEDIPPWLDQYASASIFVGGERVGELGAIHPEVAESFDLKRTVYLFRLNFERIFARKGPEPFFASLPKFPAVARDMALIAAEKLPVEEPLDFILNLKEPLLERVVIFDIFRSEQLGADKKSVGYRLTYRAPDRSLTDEEVNSIHEKLVKRMVDRFGVSLRQ